MIFGTYKLHKATVWANVYSPAHRSTVFQQLPTPAAGHLRFRRLSHVMIPRQLEVVCSVFEMIFELYSGQEIPRSSRVIEYAERTSSYF